MKEVEIEFKIQGKILAYVTDNAKNMVKAIGLLETNHIRCAAHSLQLGITKAMKLKEIEELLTKCRKIVGHFKHSSLAKSKLKHAQVHYELPNLKLVQDVPTRWNSTYYMIDMLIKNKLAINSVLIENAKTDILLISNQEEILMIRLINLLVDFQKATTFLGGENYCSASVVKVIYRKLAKSLAFNPEQNIIISKLKKTILSDLQLRQKECADILLECTFFDPRNKNLKSENEEIKKNVIDIIKKKMNAYKIETTENSLPRNKDEDFFIDSESDEEILNSPIDALEVEIDNYMRELKTRDDPLQW